MRYGLCCLPINDRNINIHFSKKFSLTNYRVVGIISYRFPSVRIIIRIKNNAFKNNLFKFQIIVTIKCENILVIRLGKYFMIGLSQTGYLYVFLKLDCTT